MYSAAQSANAVAVRANFQTRKMPFNYTTKRSVRCLHNYHGFRNGRADTFILFVMIVDDGAMHKYRGVSMNNGGRSARTARSDLVLSITLTWPRQKIPSPFFCSAFFFFYSWTSYFLLPLWEPLVIF